MLAALNDQLQERKLDAQYVTMLMALWDDTSQTLKIANADQFNHSLLQLRMPV